MNPDSFFDADSFLRSLDSVDKGELIETIGKIIMTFPQTLGLFKVSGFDEPQRDQDDDKDFAD